MIIKKMINFTCFGFFTSSLSSLQNKAIIKRHSSFYPHLSIERTHYPTFNKDTLPLSLKLHQQRNGSDKNTRYTCVKRYVRSLSLSIHSCSDFVW